MPGEEAAPGDLLEILVGEPGDRLGFLADQVGLADGVALLSSDRNDFLVASGGTETGLEGGIQLGFCNQRSGLFFISWRDLEEVLGRLGGQ